MFKSLSSSYTIQLIDYLHKSQALLSVKKGDFFPLFYAAWKISFTKKNILKAFEATGVWLIDTQVILKRFHPKTPEPKEPSGVLILSD
jgi:hypothetical protein